MNLAKLVRFSATIATAASPAAHAQFWNPTTEFSTASNPNDVWHYASLDASLNGPLLLHPSFHSGVWWASGARGEAHIWRNDRGSVAFGIAPGHLSLHPGNGFQASVLRWMNPNPSEPGTLTAQATFRPGDLGAMRVGVMVNGVLRFQALDSGSTTIVESNTSVESIDFVVWGGYSFGNTQLEASISVNLDRCIGDFNRDGGVDGSDVVSFFEAWEAGEVGADVNFSGGVDGSDVEAFFVRWEAGC